MTHAQPDFIDNRDGNTLARALAAVLGGTGVGEETPSPAEVCIASAFFSPAGFAHVADRLKAVPSIRLMLGAEPPPEALRPKRRLDETAEGYDERRLREGLQDLDAGLRAERDRLPFTPSNRGALRKLITLMRSGTMAVRRYERAFLHAKAYIFVPHDEAYGTPAGVIAGSSNLTSAGLTRNLELNLGLYDHPVVQQARRWFDDLWQEAEDYELVELLEDVFAPWTPWDVFLRVLWQLYGADLEKDAEASSDAGRVLLTSFQKHGVARALRILQAYGGVLVADEVGLGKTFMAAEVIQLYRARRQKALLICPAQLRDTTWKRFAAHYDMRIECVSFEELANDKQLAELDHRSSAKPHLEQGLDEYQLVVVDEAHNYRNPDAPTRAAVLRRLLFGQKRDLLLLTATPVNNSLWDLYHLIRFFLRQDAHLADRGILSVRARFEQAMQQDPSSLSPDVLYPIIDATTVKRTRHFVKKHYEGDTILGPDGTPQPIVFPKPQALTVRYKLDDVLPGLFDKVEAALDPDGGDEALTFLRYTPELFRKADGDEGETARANALAGLLRSGLLKRFESSACAFGHTVTKMAGEHDRFLEALKKGKVVTTQFLRELSADDSDDAFEALLDDDAVAHDAGLYHAKGLKAAVERDRDILNDLAAEAEKVTPARDPKLKALVAELAAIADQAATEATGAEDETQKRKVIVFSFFEDTARWVRDHLVDVSRKSAQLRPYKGRIVAVSGSGSIDEASRLEAVYGFAPQTSEAPAGSDTDRFDLLVSTDVLAEGVNLQQCRHIINYDMPWNPMRLVQRHGRIDRIGSQHNRVFLRTIFPVDRLDRLLNLEGRILNKLAMAAASVGVVPPIEGAAGGGQVFTETRQEIEKLLREDPSLYERGGTEAAAQTGEEYRQTLRKALEGNRDHIVHMPWKVGSGMVKGRTRGVFFCAAVSERTFLRFVPATDTWDPVGDRERIVSELGTCLRLIECGPDTPRHLPEAVEDAVFDFWAAAQDHILDAWMFETDPANLQPKVRPLNLRVAEFIRGNPPHDVDEKRMQRALDILEAPWPRREELLLRGWFEDQAADGTVKARALITGILATGLEPYEQPPVLPPIDKDDIELICWLAIEPEDATGTTA